MRGQAGPASDFQPVSVDFVKHSGYPSYGTNGGLLTNVLVNSLFQERDPGFQNQPSGFRELHTGADCSAPRNATDLQIAHDIRPDY